MKYLLLLLLVPILSASECGKKKNKTADEVVNQPTTDSIPPCLRKMITDLTKENPSDLPLKIDEYLYNGKTVYAFNAPCCDQFNMLYDDSCHAICAPSGGFTGKGDGKCPDFSKTATFIKLVWQNPLK